MSDAQEMSYPEVGARIGELVDQLSANPDERVGEAVIELLDWVDIFHRAGLSRLVEMIQAWRGEIFLESAASDEVAGTLLDAYDLRDEILPEGPAPAPVPPPQPTLVQIRTKR
jgi:hypothetical protein